MGAGVAAPVAPAPAGPLAGGPGTRLGTRYRMVQRMVAIGGDFFIQNDRGVRAFHVDGKARRVRQKLIFRDMQGNELCKIQERMLWVKDSMEIEGPRGERLAMVKQAIVTPLRERFTVSVAGGPDMDASGNILDHGYTIEQGGRSVATVSKRWFRSRDSYGVEIAPGQNDVLILAIVTCIDQLTHPGR
jgi:uncharacterized protein YxjI